MKFNHIERVETINREKHIEKITKAYISLPLRNKLIEIALAGLHLYVTRGRRRVKLNHMEHIETIKYDLV